MTFGEKVASLRKKQKWSQDQLAKKVGTSAPIIGRYERNEIKPSIEMAKKIAEQLEATLDYLIGDSSLLQLDKKTLERLEAIEQLPSEDKNRLYYFIDMVIRDVKTREVFASQV